MFTVSVWTGRQMLIHGIADGGTGWRGVTFGYTPATGTWRVLAPGPAPLMAQNNDEAVWTGSEMLVTGLTNAAYNPVTNTWHRVAFHNGPAGHGAVNVWTGHQVILWGGGCCGFVIATGAAYTPPGGSWRPLPPSPLSARSTTGAWTGTEVIIAGGSQPPGPYPGGSARGQTFADAAAYNPATRAWRKLPSMPQARADGTMLWDGTEVLYIGGRSAGSSTPSADAYAFSPATSRWRRLPAMESGRSDFAAVWTGHQVLIWGGMTGPYSAPQTPPHGLSYDPTAGQWSALPMAPLRGRAGPTAVWTGSQMIVWGGTSQAPHYTSFTDGAAYQPAP
jgi:N-acetylneuraminic acid mutarotase